ncbi:MAG: DUF1775 domain-containing protein [Geminicoccaceae bacterium]
MLTRFVATLGVALPLAMAVPALAHVTLETPEAQSQHGYKAVLRVGHGCDGKATRSLRVKIPEGFIAAKPQPKPGWQVQTVKGPYEKSYELWGEQVKEGVTEIVWSGGELPDDFYDEFVFVGRIPDLPEGSQLWFPTVQDCGDGAAHRWIEIPEPGKSEDDYEQPAPGLKIVHGEASDD